jgi:hypothetical protein
MGATHFTGPVVSEAGFITGSSDATSGTYGGAGTPASPINLGTTPDQKMVANYATTAATTGDTRLVYDKLTFTAAGSGETLRAFSAVTTGTAAVGGTVNGAHISLEVNGSGAISGAGNAIRATLGGSAASPGGTLAAIQLDSAFAAGVTLPAITAFLRVTDTNTTKIPNLLSLPAPSAGTIFSAKTSAAVSHVIKINAAGTTYYIMVSDTL